MFFRLQTKLILLVLLIFALPIFAQTPKEADLSQFDKIVGNKKYVNLGEDSHFMVEVHKLVARAFPYLVEKKGFRVFVFEAAWGTEEAFREFMNSDRTTVTGEESFYLNAFNSKYIVQMLIWIREWNRKHPNDQIQITGYQPEQPIADFRGLWEFTGRSEKFAAAGLKEKAKVCRAGTGEFKTNIEFVIDTSKRRRSGQPTYSKEERGSCNQAIDAIEKFIETNKKELIKKNSNKDYLESKAHLISLRVYLNTLTVILDDSIFNKNPTFAEQQALQKKAYEEGDKGRFEIFEILRQTRFKNKKIFFWMHNWHAMKHASEIEAYGRGPSDPSMPKGTISIGERMAKKYGKDLVVIGNIVPKANCKNPICTPPPVPENSLETPFQKVFRNNPMFVEIRKNNPSNRGLPINRAGSLYADINQGTFEQVFLNRQFDAILYLPETTATFEDK